jgi:hypothetical protein
MTPAEEARIYSNIAARFEAAMMHAHEAGGKAIDPADRASHQKHMTLFAALRDDFTTLVVEIRAAAMKRGEPIT